MKQGQKQRSELVGQFAEEARDFNANALALRTSFPGHRFEDLTRSFQVLRLAGSREISRNCGANGKIGEITQFSEKGQWIYVSIIHEEQHTFPTQRPSRVR